MKKVDQNLLFLLLVLFSQPILISCSWEEDSGSDYVYPVEEPYQPPPVLAWIEIDTPSEGQTITRVPITVSGRAGMKDVSDPESDVVRIQYDYGTTIHDITGNITCNPTCIVNWEATFNPPNESTSWEGSLTMRVWYGDAWNKVKVTYTPNRYTVSGKVSAGGTGGSVENIGIWLDGHGAPASTDLNGEFQFEVKEGSYVIGPRLGRIPPGGCMAFSPAERNLVVYGQNVTGQDFIITDLFPCYTVQGSVSADNNPGYYGYGDDWSSTFTWVIMYDGWEKNELTRVWIDRNGHYKFENIPTGSYVISPYVYGWGTMGFMGGGIPVPFSVPGHDVSIYVSSDRWVDLYLDF